MGRRGPPPTPTTILRKRGSWRANTRPDEPKPAANRPPCPKWLNGAGLGAWRKLIPQLEAMGVLTQIDGQALARYCQLWAWWAECVAFLKEEGDTYTTHYENGMVSGIRAHPKAMLALRLGDQLCRLEDRFGLSPSARAGLHLSGGEDPDANDVGKKFFA